MSSGIDTQRPGRWPRVPPLALRALAFGVLYLFVAHASAALPFRPFPIAAFWPPAGLFVAALLSSRTRHWPAFTLAGAGANVAFALLQGRTPWVALFFAVRNVLEALAGAFLVRRFVAERPRMETVREVLGLAFLSAFASTLPCALAGTGVVALAFGVRSFQDTWLLWWIRDAVSILTVAPVVLAWTNGERGRPWPARRWIEATCLVACLVSSAWAAFGWRAHAEMGPLSRQYLLVPVLLWAALRFGTGGASGSMLVISFVAVASTSWRLGETSFQTIAPERLALHLEMSLAVVAASTLLLAAVVRERIRAERELRLTRFAVDRASDPILIFDATGAIRYANEATFRLLAREPHEVIGRRSWDLEPDHSPERWSARWEQAKRTGSYLMETVATRPGGQRVPIEVSGNYLAFQGQEYLVVSVRNLADSKRAEEALRLASVGTLAAGVAHEINNPLAFVTGNMTFVRDMLERLRTGGSGAAAPADLDEALTAIDEAQVGSSRMAEIVRSLNAFSRRDDAHRAPLDVREPLQIAVQLAQNEIRHRALLVMDLGEVPPVLANAGRLQQVFLNLLVNAAQAMPEGRVDRNRVRVSSRAEPGRAVVEISDTGCGMSPQVRDRIFEPFFTTRPVGSGTGLGLSICHGIVSGLGGEIQIESEPGAGTLVRVLLPATDAKPLEDSASRSARLDAARRRILVVDDEPLVASTVQRLLSGHEVTACTDPRQALARVQAGERWDAVLCDLMMPSMTGWEFQARLQQTAPTLASRLAFITGGAFTQSAAEFLERSRQPCLEKPFDRDELCELVSRVIGRA